MANRKNISLPGDQAALVQQVRQAIGPSVPVIAVMIHGALFERSSLPSLSLFVLELGNRCCAVGGSMDISQVLSDADAVLDAYYPGQFGATAIAGEPISILLFRKTARFHKCTTRIAVYSLCRGAVRCHQPEWQAAVYLLQVQLH